MATGTSTILIWRRQRKLYFTAYQPRRVSSSRSGHAQYCARNGAYQKKRRAQGSDDPRAVPHVINTLDGKPYYKTKQGTTSVCILFIERASSYSEKPSPLYFTTPQKGLRALFSLLSDFDPSLLYETIPAFHHTPARYEAVMELLPQDRCQRAKQVRAELGFVRAHKGGHSGRYRPARHGRSAPARNA